MYHCHMQLKNDPHGSARYGASAARIEMRQVGKNALLGEWNQPRCSVRFT